MENNKLTTRKYDNYEEYTAHQKAKLGKIQGGFYKKFMMNVYHEKFRFVLKKRLLAHNLVKPHMNALCLAARLGTEVKSFIDIGCFAVGLDLNIGTDNKYVVYGDFHDIQFADNSVDVVFLNSIDHSLKINKLFSEVKRVLKKDGLFILEVTMGTEENYVPTDYEVITWKRVDDLLTILEKAGFTMRAKSEFTNPWHGLHVVMQRK